MAKIPIILESGRADGKLIKTNNVYDDNQEIFLSDKLKEIDSNHNNLNNTVKYLADEEDITKNTEGKLQFKNKEYGDGMGHVILRKNKSFAEQVIKTNTIYEIRYDFDLNGQEITIPEGCILDFQGGSLSNGKLKGANTEIICSKIYNIFNNCEFALSIYVEKLYDTWFDNLTSDIISSFNVEEIVLSKDIESELILSKPVRVTSNLHEISIKNSIVINCNNVIIYNCNFNNYAKSAILCSNETDIPYINIIIQNVSINNKEFNIPSIGIEMLGNIQNTIIENCVFQNFINIQKNKGWAVHYTWRRDPSLEDFNNYLPISNIIRNCKAYNCNSGFSFSGGYNNTIDNCLVENANQGYFLFDGHFGNLDNFNIISSITNCIAKNVGEAVSLQGSDFNSSPSIHNVNYKIDNLNAFSRDENKEASAITIIGPFDGRIEISNSTFANFNKGIRTTTYSEINEEHKGKGNLFITSNYINNCMSNPIYLYLPVGSINIEKNIINSVNTKDYFITIYNAQKYIFINSNIFRINNSDSVVGFIRIYSNMKDEQSFFSLRENYFDGTTNYAVSFVNGFPNYLCSTGNISPYAQLYAGSTQKGGIAAGRNRIDFSYSDGDNISYGVRTPGDLIVDNSSKYIVCYKYHGTACYHTNDKWEQNKKVNNGQLIYYNDYVYLVFGDGVLGEASPTHTTINSVMSNGTVNLINLGIRYSTKDNSIVYSDYSCTMNNLPTDNVPNGYKVYVIDKKCIAVYFNKVWINTSNGIPLSYGALGNQRPPSGDMDSGRQYFDTTINKPIWWTGTKWVDATGADV